MQTITNPARTDALLAGAIIEEYRDLLNSFETLQAARKPGAREAQADTEDCDQNCADTPSCQPNQTSVTRSQLASWNDLPRA